MRHLGVLVVVRVGRPGVRFHCKETEGEVSDDSDDEVQCASASAWKYGPVKRPHASKSPCRVEFQNMSIIDWISGFM